MTDTVKLIIEIPKDYYEIIKHDVDNHLTDYRPFEIIANGTPLDDVKAEIKGWYWQADKQALAKDPCVVDAMVDLFIRTIDSIGKAESEE